MVRAQERETARKALCADVSHASDEPLTATASHVEHWILVEYRAVWGRDVLGASRLSDRLKRHLREQIAALPRTRLLFIRQPDRRRHPRWRLYFGSSPERGQRFFALEFDDHEDLVGLDLVDALAGGAWPGVPLDHPLLVACVHGKRDRCCAKYGWPLYDELRGEAQGEWVWQSTHVGGDRFAGNLVCLPHGLYFGRVGPSDVRPLLDAYLAGEIHLDNYRGRSCYSFPVQAAERAVREETGLAGIDDLRLLDVEASDDEAWRVRFATDAGARVHEVEVVSEVGDEPIYLTCSAATPRRVRRYVTGEYRVLAGR